MSTVELTREELDHALHVVQQVRKEDRVVAFFHDAIEDSWDGVIFGVLSPDEQAALLLLTRKGTESYRAYIDRIAAGDTVAHRIAQRVKVEDLRHNLSRMDAEHESLRPRYEDAMTVLCSRLGWPLPGWTDAQVESAASKVFKSGGSVFTSPGWRGRLRNLING